MIFFNVFLNRVIDKTQGCKVSFFNETKKKTKTYLPTTANFIKKRTDEICCGEHSCIVGENCW